MVYYVKCIFSHVCQLLANKKPFKEVFLNKPSGMGLSHHWSLYGEIMAACEKRSDYLTKFRLSSKSQMYDLVTWVHTQNKTIGGM